uniref:Protein translocase subunit SecA n=1 Tax=Mallomonas splendens TaxID=52552 RepID=A0A3G2QZX1_9STRA|nr:preprotein translocase subunit SecA [Mallomonas splendens]YP_009545458.1 preprotein translocase subunit SecA [Mallomonas splendens]AYO28603.1 preprotein translocase subunit SecA [Mallomonas splendens]AYO28612.1 preprotein translocase subunit SecA [Mallomonas splendens]
MKQFVYEIKIESTQLRLKTEEELRDQTEKLKKRSQKEELSKIIPQWFALVQEISNRKLGLKHFDTQLLAGVHLHQGKIVEMKTGEGKTLASTLPVSLNALLKKGVHVVTVNDYLAERDQKWMGKIYTELGLSVGLVKSTSSVIEKKKSYFSDITYVTNSEVVFDYLRDSSASHLTEVVQRPFSFCVIDEIDSILIDEARTPLILSTVSKNLNKNKLFLAKFIANWLEKDVHFQVDEKRRDINLTESGYKKAKEKLGKNTLYDSNDPWILEILNALKAQYIFKLNKDYIVLNNKILIVDEFTGRIMEDRRWSLGIHEAIEAKENVLIGGGTKTKSSITYQNFFTLYPKLAGMTGTGKTAEKEFQDIYKLEVVVLPTAKPMIRKDFSDLVYQTELAKWKAVLNKTKECFSKGQPILIGTASVEKSEFLSELFKISKIPHQILNAKPENVARESEIVAQAGERYAVTIATNMAGRGTDIILGGNTSFKVKQKLREILIENKNNEISLKKEEEHLLKKIFTEYETREQLELDLSNLPYSLETCQESLRLFYNSLYEEISKSWIKENSEVKSLGGLFVLGTERHETRRIDNQLRGRAGRQGDPGNSQFYVSLEDELMKIFGGENIRRWVEYLVQDKDIPLESNLLTSSLENAQKKVENYNYDLRKNVFQYDEILNVQRKELFQARNEILRDEISEDFFFRYCESFLDEQILSFIKKTSNNYFFKLQSELQKWFDSYSIDQLKTESKETPKNLYSELWISNDLRFAQSNLYQQGFLQSNRSILYLLIIDIYWTEHLERMTYIRETINWRAYGQQNPLMEYNVEAFQSFKLMFDQIRSAMIYYFLNNPLNY